MFKQKIGVKSEAMKKIIIFVVLVIILSMLALVIVQEKKIRVSETEKEQYITEAYFEVFKELGAEYGGEGSRIKYLSVDLTKVKAIDKEKLVPFIKEHCAKRGLQMLQYTPSELREKGYSDKYGNLINTVSIYMGDAAFKNGKVIISGSTFLGPLAGSIADYTLYKEFGVWVVEVSNVRIS